MVAKIAARNAISFCCHSHGQTKSRTSILRASKKSVQQKLAKELQRVPPEIVNGVPVNLEEIGKHWGVQRVIERPLPYAGMVHRLGNGQSFVFLNKDDALGRRRFSWAHELGHIVMSGHQSPAVSCRAPGQRDAALERSCDVIAAEILMPSDKFSEELTNLGWSLLAVRTLANTFQVTVQAATRRLTELIAEPTLMSVWRLSATQALIGLKHSWSIPNQGAANLRPQVQWRTGPDYLPSLYQCINENGVVSGSSRVLINRSRESRYLWVHTEAMGVGRGDRRTIIAIHYLDRGQIPT